MLVRSLVVLALLITALPLYAGAVPGSIDVDIDGVTYPILYDVQDVIVVDAVAYPDLAMLAFDVQVNDSLGFLAIVLERSLLDALSEVADNEILVITDGGNALSPEIITSEIDTIMLLELESQTEAVDVIIIPSDNVSISEDAEMNEMADEPAEMADEPAEMADEPAEMVDEPAEMIEDDLATPPVLQTEMVDEPTEMADEPAEMADEPAEMIEDDLATPPVLQAEMVDEPAEMVEETSPNISGGLLVGVAGAGTIAAALAILLYLIGIRDRSKNR